MRTPMNCVKKGFVNRKIYKPLRFYDNFKSFYCIPLIFGYNYIPFITSKSRFVSIVFLSYSLFISFGSSILVLCSVKSIPLSPFTYVVVEYIIPVSILVLANGKYNIQESFFKTLEVIDKTLQVSASYYSKLNLVSFVSALCILFCRIFSSIAICYSIPNFCHKSNFVVITTVFVTIAVDSNQFPRLIVFELIKYRMCLLRSRVENLFQNETVSVVGLKDKRNTLVLYQETYGSILDSIDTASRLFNPHIMLSLICSFPKIMLLLHYLIKLHKVGVSLLYLLMLGMEVVQWGVVSCLPGFVFEMTRAQVDQMKLFLLQQYTYCSSDIIRPEIKEFMEYIEKRPCQYYLYRLIPVDVTLPVGLLHLCTTYLIVMIQFSNILEDNQPQ